MIITLSIITIFIVSVKVFMSQDQFGKHPTGERLEKIKKSPNYKNGAFRNISHTPTFTEGGNYYNVTKKFFFEKKIRVAPTDVIPSIKTDLLKLKSTENVLVWFGHSSYFIQIDGKKILVDPVLSGSASPIASTTRAFKGADIYKVEDIPEIDYLFITHDHWDHCDHKTLVKLKPKIKKVICALGVGAHLEHWGYDKSFIEERDWNEDVNLGEGFTVHTTSARHFSGRTFTRGKSIWVSFVLQTPSTKIFIGGDSGYDRHFAETGKKFGPFDLAILENGQYDKYWKHIHMMPHEVLLAASELNAKKLLPVHSGKFTLSTHAWDAPLKTITQLNENTNLQLLTPLIGERVNLKDETQKFSHWWVGIN